MSKETATTLVNQFVLNPTTPSQWPKIERIDLGTGLLARIEDPNRIDQAGTPLCGPSAMVRSLAISNPDAYAQAAIDLYSKANARIRALDVKPGNELKRAPVPANTNPADWIMLGSVRDTNNWFLSPAGWFQNNFAGVTLPMTIEKWFRSAGYTKVINKRLFRRRVLRDHADRHESSQGFEPERSNFALPGPLGRFELKDRQCRDYELQRFLFIQDIYLGRWRAKGSPDAAGKRSDVRKVPE